MTAVRPIRNPLVIGIVAVLVSIIGCQNVTPLKTVVQAREIYTTAMNEANTLRKAGKIDDKAALIIEPIRKTAAQALDDAEAAAISGVPAKFEAAKATAIQAAQDLAAEIAKHR